MVPPGMERLLLFLKTLETIAHAKDYERLSSAGYTGTVNTSDTERINVVMNYIMQHYADDVTVEEIASLSNLAVPSFCRYFKSRTQKIFSEFLNEVRILNARKLLVKTEMTITQICYETGYNNISHFNRQFKLITGLTAKEYAKKYKQSLI
jgi:YesN/AraC family two-component response regulator